MNTINKTYTNASKEELSLRITKIKTKSHYVTLFRIIHEHNASYTRVANKGVYIELDKYNDELLSDIEKFMNKTYPITILKPVVKGMYSDKSEDYDYKALKLTNHERNILKRKDNTDNSVSASENSHKNRTPIIKQLV